MNLFQAIYRPLRPAARIRSPSGRKDIITTASPGVVFGGNGAQTWTGAQKLSSVFAAVDIRSNSMSILPAYVMDTKTRQHVDHSIISLLSLRPNKAMTASVRKKLLETSVLLDGNAYDWILRDPVSRRPVELIPLPGSLVTIAVDETGTPWYWVANPKSGERFMVANEDICHYKGPSRNGYSGESVLSYAATTIGAGLAAQEYSKAFYESGGQPAGVLEVDADLSGYVEDQDGNLTTITKKDAIRAEWERVHSGAENAHKIAVLDYGMKYKAMAISQRDSQFVEQQAVTTEDIARFFCVPLYKLQSGKQSYNSNEQNSIEYLSNLQPRITQMEEEQTYKLLMSSEIDAGLEIRYNMMAILRGDSEGRARAYQSLWQMGALSANEIRDKEDMPAIDGGDEHMASLNYVPLRMWADLSMARNKPGGEKDET